MSWRNSLWHSLIRFYSLKELTALDGVTGHILTMTVNRPVCDKSKTSDSDGKFLLLQKV